MRTQTFWILGSKHNSLQINDFIGAPFWIRLWYTVKMLTTLFSFALFWIKMLLVTFILFFLLSTILASLKLEHYARECKFWNFDKIKKKNNKQKQQQKKTHTNFWLNFCLNKECPKLPCGLDIGHRRRQTIPKWNSSGGGGGFFRASLYVWCLRYWALCDDLVDFKLWAGVIYLSFSTDTAPQWILWKRIKQGGLVPPGLKRWPFKLIKHFADTTRVSPSGRLSFVFHLNDPFICLHIIYTLALLLNGPRRARQNLSSGFPTVRDSSQSPQLQGLYCG